MESCDIATPALMYCVSVVSCAIAKIQKHSDVAVGDCVT